ncbi:MAG: hypothetical protein PHI77_01905, partial [Candidatus Pacebacteria bacterium]|nr:hypothetical protein [Candidatus Paceibacterota bacterium]
MPFITKGAANIKYLAIVISVAVIAAAFIILYPKINGAPAEQLYQPQQNGYIQENSARTAEDCEVLPEEMQESCYFEVALNEKNIVPCNKIKSEEAKEQCFSAVASAAQDSSLCDGISTQARREFCYSGVAAAKQDPSLCD